jgi:putative Ca2+/H+ antiporter (TMEM165/GDT1 family)
MEAFLVSMTVVALGEIGDKTRLLALMLAVRFRRPWPIVAGILVATLVNHTIAAALGSWIRGVVPADVLKWLLALSFFAVVAWALKPDTLGMLIADVPAVFAGKIAADRIPFKAVRIAAALAFAALGARILIVGVPA